MHLAEPGATAIIAACRCHRCHCDTLPLLLRQMTGTIFHGSGQCDLTPGIDGVSCVSLSVRCGGGGLRSLAPSSVRVSAPYVPACSLLLARYSGGNSNRQAALVNLRPPLASRVPGALIATRTRALSPQVRGSFVPRLFHLTSIASRWHRRIPLHASNTHMHDTQPRRKLSSKYTQIYFFRSF
jgi:hypothetical protein